MKQKRRKLSDQIRDAIEASPMSRYAICKEIGFSQSTMSRFINGETGISMDVLDRVADIIGMNITTVSDAKTGKER
jgi:transcriptional regulator with XRE-family HTH domain